MKLLTDSDSWRETLESLGRHKLRSALTAFGVFWGMFMLVNLLGMAKGLENGFKGKFGSSHSVIYFWAGRPSQIPYQGLPVGRRLLLRDDDFKGLKTRFPEIKFLALSNGYGDQQATRNQKSEAFILEGVNPAESMVNGYILSHGRFINELDAQYQRKVVAIGERVKNVLFEPEENPVGKYIHVLGIPLMVIGVFELKGAEDWQTRDRRRILLPRETLKKLTNMGDQVHWFAVILEENSDGKQLEAEIKATLRQKHKFHPDDTGVIGSWNGQEAFNKGKAVFSAIQAFGWLVAIGTIFAGAVGVGNIMLITVKERTKEIGIRKALGATPVTIIFSVVKESLVLSFIAGYLGLVAGVLTVEAVAALVAQGETNSRFADPDVSFSTAMVAMAVLLFASAFAAFIPARKAANIDPVAALQDE